MSSKQACEKSITSICTEGAKHCSSACTMLLNVYNLRVKYPMLECREKVCIWVCVCLRVCVCVTVLVYECIKNWVWWQLQAVEFNAECTFVDSTSMKNRDPIWELCTPSSGVRDYQEGNLACSTFHVLQNKQSLGLVWPRQCKIISFRNAWSFSALVNSGVEQSSPG